ncbi:MAG TPA: urate hydroxylase PuuD, partial [Bacteroidia bacterium]|nr:urate hydroxylase PuuD [Bacteroidia bacterium]
MQQTETPDPRKDELEEDLNTIRSWRNVLVGAAILLPLGYLLWQGAGTLGWQPHLLDWLHLIVRWAHVVLGVAWIGASFYFIFLENSLNRTKDLRDELAGNLWAIHGGGFYYVEKYKNAPQKLPEKLHWFKYEAYFTWLTGMLLLTIVYYFNAKAFMVDPAVRDISPLQAIGIGIGSLFAGWFIYDALCKSPLL